MIYKNRYRGLLISNLLLLLLGCTDPVANAPDVPKPLLSTPEYLFGNHVASMDTRAWTGLWDRAQPHFDGLTLTRWALSTDTDWQSLKTYYDTQLPEKDGWAWDSRFSHAQAGYAWSFARSRHGEIVIVVGLKPAHQEGGKVPVNIITNLKPSS